MLCRVPPKNNYWIIQELNKKSIPTNDVPNVKAERGVKGVPYVMKENQIYLPRKRVVTSNGRIYATQQPERW